MPRKQVLSENEKYELFKLPESEEELIRCYSLSERDISIIQNNCRGKSNKLGFAILLSYMRNPGIILPVEIEPDKNLLHFLSSQIEISYSEWYNYSKRKQTRREHLALLQDIYDYRSFTDKDYEQCVNHIYSIALETYKGIILAKELIKFLQTQRILIPPIQRIEKICAEALTKAEKEVCSLLASLLTIEQKYALDGLLVTRQGHSMSTFNWLMQSPAAANSKHILLHISKLKIIKSISIPIGITRNIHLNYLSKFAREGSQMTSQHLSDFEQNRKYATLIAVLLEIRATITDEIIEIHDKIMNSLFKDAQNKQKRQLQNSGKNINTQLQLFLKLAAALLNARETGEDPFDAVESVISWEELYQSIIETKDLSQKENFDYLYLIGDNYPQIRKYTPSFLQELDFKAAPVPYAQSILEAIEIIKQLNKGTIKKLPKKLPAKFIRSRWENLIFTDNGVSRKYYELCILSELKNYLRSGDIWLEGSRRYKDFEDYLISREEFIEMKNNQDIGLNITLKAEEYLNERLDLLKKKLEIVCNLAEAEELPEVSLNNGKIKVKPLTNLVPKKADELIRKVYNLLPNVKITDLLIEVDNWTGFTDSYTHLKSGEKTKEKNLLLTAILSDAINLGIRKMAESSPDISYARLSWQQAWHIREETYSSALASIINYHHKHPFSVYWGEGKVFFGRAAIRYRKSCKKERTD